jgi:cap1 methyltransferase
MNFCLDIENINDEYFNEYIEKNNIELRTIPFSKNLLFQKFYKTISFEKEKIDLLENSEDWDKMKKIGNPYELIYTNYNKKRKNDSISKYIPISRSYFKMWEIFYNFNLLKKFDSGKQHIFSHLAEGPGGFMEATYNYKCKITNKKILTDTFYGITLKPTNNYIPCFSKVKKIFQNNENVNIEYGNLYIIEDVRNFIKKFNEKKSIFVSADGGFDYSSNFNGQEINSCQIIYSECIIALNILKEKGCFVCKVFDLFSVTMTQLLFILFICFEKISIYKPETSRPANSEKYLICMYYKDNLSVNIKNKLLEIIEIWQNNAELLKENNSIIFKNIKINNIFIQKMNEYNKKYMEIQLFYLNNTIELTQNKIDKDKYYEIIQKQVNNAIEWCTKYNIEINKNSIYYIKNIT